MSYITFFEEGILSTKVVPQGHFGRIKLYFERKKRPAGASWADKIVFWARKASRKELLGAQECQINGQEVQSSSFIAFSSDQGHPAVWGGEP